MSRIDLRRLAMAMDRFRVGWRRPPPRKPRPGSEPQPAEPPRGPLPMQGGAAAEGD